MKRPRIRPRLPRWRRASEAPAASADEPDAKTAKREAGTRKIGGRGSASRAAAGAIRIGNTIGAAIANRRLLGPVEARLATFGGGPLVGLASLFPRILAYPVALIAAWGGLALLVRGGKLWRERRRAAKTP